MRHLALALTAAILAISPATPSSAQQAFTEPSYQPYDGSAAPRVRIPSTAGVSAGPRPSQPRSPAVPAPSNPDPETTVTVDRGAANPPPAPPAAPKKPRYAVGQVIVGRAAVADGHSMTVSGHAIRLHGVEAPGLAQTCSTASGTAWRCGQEAMKFLSSLADGKDVTCTVTAPAGHGAAALCGGRSAQDLGKAMAEAGLAVPNGHDRGYYSAASAAAKQAGRGLWLGRFDPPWDWRRGNP